MFRGEKRGPVTLLLSLALVLAMASAAAATGTIKGTVTSKDGKPLAYANVILVGTNLGAMSLADGKFTINGVPDGNYTVRAMMMGYKTVELKRVVVEAGVDVHLDFKMTATIVAQTQEIVVTADRPMVEVTESKTTGRVRSDRVVEMPVDDILGKAFVLYWSWNADSFRPRWGRIGMKIR